MSSRLMVGLALVLLLGAAAAGYWGVTLSKNSGVAEAPDVVHGMTASPGGQLFQTKVAGMVAVQLARDVPAHTPLSESDLLEEALTIAPPGSYSEAGDLVGKTLWRALPAGTVLRESSFVVGGPLARMIRPNERALAIEIDEVVGAGGHLQPGDYVDVLLFLRQDDKNSDRTMQVVVPALRVVSVGSELGVDLAGEPIQAAENNGAGKGARSAVLAVPEGLLTRFALAAQVGTLQLAVRSAGEQRLAAYLAGDAVQVDKINQQLFQFEKFALRQAENRQPGLIARHSKTVEVIRGDTVSRETP